MSESITRVVSPSRPSVLGYLALGMLGMAFVSDKPAFSQISPVPQRQFPAGQLEPMIVAYQADRDSLRFKYTIAMSRKRMERFQKFYKQQLDQLGNVDFSGLSHDGKVDYLLFQNELRNEITQLELELKKDQQIIALIPFWTTVVTLAEAKEYGDPIVGHRG